MRLTTTGVARRSGEIECPVMDPELEGRLKQCLHTSGEFSEGILEFLSGKSPEAQALWLTRCVESGRALFQPWCLEILIVLGVMRRRRFGELQHLLGISSRTLSDKLQLLREEGLVEREVYDEQPVRIEYVLTKQGKRVAALASPLFAQINKHAAAAPEPPRLRRPEGAPAPRKGREAKGM